MKMDAKRQFRLRSRVHGIALISISTLALSIPATAQDHQFHPDNVVVSRSVYDNNAGNVTVGTVLPPNCASTTGGCSAASGAPYDGTYPTVWNNNLYDGSFGITSRIFLDQITPWGQRINSLEVPNSLER